ncbi:hypothetical protein H072_1587 [Dactylellina haptotyla CBS 200.50]|uniref:Ketoreductase (KR) domain-containing protein n=1 Tax=Dactylellina haptotyla (strain CBS 200.50) TaxID=1284197 RepID=S8ATY0_DACHA|nr:hypothetical protein H072_1587 [Dactylellina haptotyla CBS 200.50]
MSRSFGQFVRDQRTTLPLIPTAELCAGKTFIVTGGNTGLGYEAVKHLVTFSSRRVILTARSDDKGKQAVSSIEAATGKTGIVEYWNLDLTSYDSIKSFARKVAALDRLDAIIENAGVALAEFTTAEGVETSLTVNVTGTYLLAILVLPKLRETAKKFNTSTRLTIIGSSVAFQVPGKLEGIDGDFLEHLSAKANGMADRYQTSKLLQFYAFRELAARNPLRETGVIINWVNPGLCYSELTRNAPFLVRTQINVMRLLLARSTEVGSRTLLHGAFAGEESHGSYLSECTEKNDTVPEYITNASGKAIQKRVWDSLAKRLNTTQPGCA